PFVAGNQKIAPQRLDEVSLTLGNVVNILADWARPTETALAGWGGRTRTCTCPFQKPPLKCRANFRQFSGIRAPETIRGALCKTDTQLPPEPYARQLADERNNGGYTNL